MDALHPIHRDSIPFTGALIHYIDVLDPIHRSSDTLHGCAGSHSQEL